MLNPPRTARTTVLNTVTRLSSGLPQCASASSLLEVHFKFHLGPRAKTLTQLLTDPLINQSQIATDRTRTHRLVRSTRIHTCGLCSLLACINSKRRTSSAFTDTCERPRQYRHRTQWFQNKKQDSSAPGPTSSSRSGAPCHQ